MGELTSESYQGMGPVPGVYREDQLKAAADRAQSPVEDALVMLERDAVRLTQLVDQLDGRLLAVLAESVPHPTDPDDAPPGSSPLVAMLMLTHTRLAADLSRLDRLIRRVEVG